MTGLPDRSPSLVVPPSETPATLQLALEDLHVDFRRSLDDVLSELRVSFDTHSAVIASFLPGVSASSPATGSRPVSFDDFRAFYLDAAKSFSVTDAIAEANRAAVGTTVPDEFAHDTEALLALGSLVEFIKKMHAVNDPGEFNDERARRLLGLLSDNDISARLRAVVTQIAQFGSPYCVPPEFQVFSSLQELRAKTLQLGLCHLKHAIKLRGKGKCILLRISELPEGFFETFGIDLRCMAHWTLKWRADGSLQPDGRFLLDMNEDPLGLGMSLNSPACKAESHKFYGDLSYPSIVDFIRDIYVYCQEHNHDLADIRMFVEDNKGAFNCLKKAPEDCRLICVRVSVDWLMLPIYGCFGHHAEPFAWDQPATALDALLHKRLHGVFRRYVDDRFHAAHKDVVAFDHELVVALNELVYGPDPLDPEKSQPDSSVISAIGWTLDTFRGTLRPNDKATKKLVLAFFSVSIRPHARWPLKVIQALASLASRYSLALVGMRPFVQPFNQMLSSASTVDAAKRPYTQRCPSSEARFAVMLWRAVAITLWIAPDALAVPMFSVLPEVHAAVGFRPFTDAADRLGIRLYDAHGTLLHWVSYKFPFITADDRLALDPSYQNSREFMGVIGVLLVLRLRLAAPPGTVVIWTNDNRSALSWVRDNVARSRFAQLAFTAYSWICTIAGYIVPDAIHSPATTEEMLLVDGLSRNYNLDEHDPLLGVALGAYPHVDRLFLLLDPARAHENPESLAAVFQQISSIVHLLFSS